MKKIVALLFFGTSALIASAQDQPSGPVTVHTLAQMLRTQLTITPAWSATLISGDNNASISGGRTNIYLHGTAEYYWDERFSTRGDAYYFLNKSKEKGGMKHNHGFQVGVSYHLIKGSNIDPFIGMRGGLNITQINPMDFNDSLTLTWLDYNVPAHVDPTWAPVVGVNFYGERIFHFFVEGAYMMGTYRPTIGPQLSLEEFRLSVGLGWNFSLYKPVEEVRQKI